MIDLPRFSRREALIQGSTTLALLAFFDSPLFGWGRQGETIVPFLDQPPPPPQELVDALGDLQLLDWQRLDSWLTPREKFFNVGHYAMPRVEEKDYRLEITGLVENPRTYRLEDIRALPKKEVLFALECSGNSGFPWLQGAIGNARWAGAPLAEVLQKAGIDKNGIEVVFFGHDEGEETIPYLSGTGDKVGDIKMKLSFARSMSLGEAMHPSNLLCYEMNQGPLRRENGFPLRLIAPGWYGIANVKWLKRIEIRDTRFMGPFMAERYVTIREEPREGGEVVWTRMSVGKSQPR